MDAWKRAFRAAVVPGNLAGALSTLALVAAGQRETGHPAAAVNTASHWLWGEEALRADAPSLRHTLTACVTQQLAGMFWSTLYHRVHGDRLSAGAPQAVAGAVATAATAALVDYTLVPKRFTPGYEHRLSRGGMVAAFACLAAGFAVGDLLQRRR